MPRKKRISQKERQRRAKISKGVRRYVRLVKDVQKSTGVSWREAQEFLRGVEEPSLRSAVIFEDREFPFFGFLDDNSSDVAVKARKSFSEAPAHRNWLVEWRAYANVGDLAAEGTLTVEWSRSRAADDFSAFRSEVYNAGREKLEGGRKIDSGFIFVAVGMAWEEKK